MIELTLDGIYSCFLRGGARDPTAPSVATDPGLVLVRGPDRRDLQDQRKGWIMSVKLTDAQLERFRQGKMVLCPNALEM